MDTSRTASQEQGQTTEARPCSTTPARSSSCTTCAKAKSKCVRYGCDDKCERCTRLGKECQERRPTKRKRKSTKITRAVQLRNLEDKLEHIAVALSSQQGPGSRKTTELDEFAKEILPQTWNPELEDSDQCNGGPGTFGVDKYSKLQQHCRQQSPPKHMNPESDMVATEVLFDRYLRLLAPFMPFVILPAGATASRSDPFLLNAISVVAYFHDTAKQQSMAKELMRELSERLLINGERSLSLLQGLLILINWYNPHLFYPQNLNNIIHLAMALTTDLNIDRGPGNCEKAQIEAAAKAYGVPQPAKTISNDERRAVLGTFYLASRVFSSFRKVDVLSWTPWHTECARALEEAKEYGSDALVLQLARMQRVMQDTMVIENNSVPVKLYANSFLNELAQLQVLPGNSGLGLMIKLQEACTRIAIWQRSFAGLNNASSSSHVVRQRLDGMWRCMESTKEFLEIYFQLSIEDYVTIPFGVFAQFAYAFVVIIRALSLDLPGWDMSTLREYIDFSSIMENAASRYERVKGNRVDGMVLDNDGFARWASRIRWAKAFYEAKIMAATSTTQQNNLIEPGVAGLQPPVEAETAQQLPSQPKDAWLDSFVNLEDFWNGFDMNSLQPADLGLNMDVV